MSAPRRTKIVVASTGVVLVLAIGALLFVLLRTTEEDRVAEAVDRFVTAVDTEDQAGILDALCGAEAASLTGDDDFDPAYNGHTSGSPREREIAGVRIDGDVAAARLTRPGQPPTTLYLLRENGGWKVCAPAAERFAGA
ncbi:hypothetical protein GCM10017786_45970 [Amycolatopsis deserti]|uniref:DUF4878 domain-containing protein n=1 Tax=Amycolatopsis deserti TaxID=185696 RepID=A0ABQ3J7S0_9PSEU|nr:hypothetical protein [Amycolatopsis deserti]GHF07166.1 hypothetical protein GCM10017786_45970 [Amycolatopsis deserti]